MLRIEAFPYPNPEIKSRTQNWVRAQPSAGRRLLSPMVTVKETLHRT